MPNVLKLHNRNSYFDVPRIYNTDFKEGTYFLSRYIDGTPPFEPIPFVIVSINGSYDDYSRSFPPAVSVRMPSS